MPYTPSMFSRRLVWPLLAALLATSLVAEEQNGWPLVVRQTPPDAPADSVQFLGPLIFHQQAKGEVQGVRPLLLQATVEDREIATLLYPLFVWKRQPGFDEFSFFKLINLRHEEARGSNPEEKGFDV